MYVCRLPQDTYQTAKIAKLLLMMEKGEAADCHGKTLEEIDVLLEKEAETVDDGRCDVSWLINY